MDIELEKMRMQLQTQIEQMKNQTLNTKIEVDREKNQQAMQVKMQEIQNENIIEQQYINEQKRSNQVGEQLSAIQMQIQALLDNENIKIADKKASIGNRHEKVSDR